MTKTITLGQLERVLARDMKRLMERSHDAVGNTASKAVRIVQKNAPKAFGELVESVHATDNKTIVSAPHAEAVEVGSRPHMVPLEELIRWVKLRGMQGLSASGKVRRRNWKATGMGSTTAENARRIARELKDMRGERTHSSIDAPREIAKRIQSSILKNGTKPSRFVMRSLPEVAAILHTEMQKAFK